jgi:hypothetical protein
MKLSNIANMETIFAILGLLFMILFTPTLQSKYHTFYQFIFLVCIVAVLSNKKTLRILFTKYSLPILITLVVFFLFWLIDHGDRSSTTLKSFIRGLTLFVMSFVISGRDNRFQIMVILLSFGLLILAYQMMGSQLFSFDVHENRVLLVKTVAENMYLEHLEYSNVSSHVIVFVAYISFSITLAYSFLDYSPRMWVKVVVFLNVFLTLLFCLKSLWTAPIIILTLSIFIFRAIIIFTATNRHIKQKVYFIIKTIMMLAILMTGISVIISTFEKGEAFYRAERLRMIFANLFTFNNDTVDLDYLTSGRLALIGDSIKGFYMAPFFGIGDLTHSKYLSNHASNVDFLARFGLAGFIPITGMFYYYTHLSYQLVKMQIKEEKWTHISLLTFFIIFYVSNFGNPYFITSTPEILFFVSAGFVSGRHERYTRKIVTAV